MASVNSCPDSPLLVLPVFGSCRHAKSEGRKKWRRIQIPSALYSSVDWHLTDMINSGDTEGLGAFAADPRYAAFYPVQCDNLECHRFIVTIDGIVRKHANRAFDRGDGMLCLACRSCSGPGTWVHSQAPSKLERHAYPMVQSVFGDGFYHVYELHLPSGRHSIDLMLIKKSDVSKCVAVHVDGRQHVDAPEVDAEVDAMLHAMHARTVRLRIGNETEWDILLHKALQAVI
jgi:hypothetical protein